ncbi:MAG: phosphoribosylformylglycinamidine synthase, partial [Myxococcales bacterium]
ARPAARMSGSTLQCPAAFHNEFGRPGIVGYFRTFEQPVEQAGGPEVRGYHKPIMLAGGLGTVRPGHVAKERIAPGGPIVVLGGPALRIGLGGGAASSVASGASDAELDFASVQRDNAEMQRRCQEVIDRCWGRGDDNPIAAIHDVGAGGLSNALPELVHDSERGARFELRAIPSDEPGMSPLEIWSNEAQERYVLGLRPGALDAFAALCRRERAPFAVVGHATDDGHLRLDDSLLGDPPVDLPLGVLLGRLPRQERTATRLPFVRRPLDLAGVTLDDALERVLRLPTVADKSFLVTIGDRTVTGLIARDPMVGAAQVPVADAAVTLADHEGHAGEAMAIGERAPVALLDAAAAARLAVTEAITNLLSTPVARLGDIKLSANWMAAAGHPNEDARLFDAVRAVGLELAPALGIAIPVGKDSLSMRTTWTDAAGERHTVASPLSLVVSAFAPLADVRGALTPELTLDEPTRLVLIDLGRGQHRLGGSCLAQVYRQLGDTPPDLDDPALLRGLFAAVRELTDAARLLAYHDRSDGGLLVTLLEMAFASTCGLALDLAPLGPPPDAATALAWLFAEEPGAVVQVRAADVDHVRAACARHGLGDAVHDLGAPVSGSSIQITHAGRRRSARARRRTGRAGAPGRRGRAGCRRAAGTPA